MKRTTVAFSPREKRKGFLTMKRSIKVLALFLLLAMAATAFVGCGKRLSGTYEHVETNGQVSLLVFDGEEFTYSLDSTQLIGTYEIKKEGENYRIIMMYDETVVDGKVKKLDEPLYIGSEKGVDLLIGEGFITVGSGLEAAKYTKK